jgi:uncharacterized membrane protein HdeD (DUF308 family)
MPVDLPRAKTRSETSLRAAADRLRAKRGWIIGFGLFTALLGLAALVLVETATIASVLVIGLFMAIAGVLEMAIGFRTRTWGRLLLWEAAGLVYLAAGLFAIAVPELASIVITLLLGAGMLATGILRVVLGLRIGGSRAKGGIIGAGLVTGLLGILILASWPGSSVVVLGTLLGIDLLIYGLTWILFAWRLGAQRR